MPRSPLAALSRISLATALVSVIACNNDSRPLTASERLAERNSKRGIAQRAAVANQRAFAPSNLSSVTARKLNTTAPYERHDGWLVRGTDLLLFLPCENGNDYYIVSAPAVQARLKQFYRFATQRPYVPVFVEMSSRLVDDTMTVADYHFTRLVEVKDFHPDSIGKPSCGRPTIGRILDHVRRYEPNI